MLYHEGVWSPADSNGSLVETTHSDNRKKQSVPSKEIQLNGSIGLMIRGHSHAGGFEWTVESRMDHFECTDIESTSIAGFVRWRHRTSNGQSEICIRDLKKHASDDQLMLLVIFPINPEEHAPENEGDDAQN